jgi:ribosomal protein L14E/L6E/L27E
MQETYDDLIGRVAVSKAGRDKDRAFVITAVLDAEYVWIVDGGLRKLERPKKKKRKHLSIQPAQLEQIRLKILEGKQVFDAEIRNSLRSIGYNLQHD